MASNGSGDQPGEFHADIPQEFIDAALKSVEKVKAEPAAEESSASAEEVKALRAMLEESTARAAQTQERLKETHERYVRSAADFENFKKRATKDREDTVKYGTERILKEFLLVSDNLERALASGGDAAALQTGLKLVLKGFADTLGKFGVTSFSAVGQPFDPTRHEALMQAESAEVPAGSVVSEMVKGYMLHERLLRPAAVVVSRGKPEPVAEAAPPDAPAEPTTEG